MYSIIIHLRFMHCRHIIRQADTFYAVGDSIRWMEKKEYLQAAEDIWNFIQNRVIDPDSGEWIECVPADNSPDPKQALVHSWKCPYHNGRMCMEMINRLSQAS